MLTIRGGLGGAGLGVIGHSGGRGRTRVGDDGAEVETRDEGRRREASSDIQRRWRWLRIACSASLDRIWAMNVGGKVASTVNLGRRAPTPTCLFIALCNGGPPTMGWLGTPDPDVDQTGVGPTIGLGPRSTLTFSPLIFSYTLLILHSQINT